MDKVVFICKYSPTCNWKCEKCPYLLKELKIVESQKSEELYKDFKNMNITCDCT
jgi:hypothetical protein